MLLATYPKAPTVAVSCDNDGIHHAATVQQWIHDHPRLRLIYGAAYSPHDNPTERIWATLKIYLANTAVTWTECIHQARVFFRQRAPGQMLTTAAPQSSPWLPRSYAQNLRESALAVPADAATALDGPDPVGEPASGRQHRPVAGAVGAVPSLPEYLLAVVDDLDRGA
jgi:hypothetical protein